MTTVLSEGDSNLVISISYIGCQENAFLIYDLNSYAVFPAHTFNGWPLTDPVVFPYVLFIYFSVLFLWIKRLLCLQ